MAKRRCPTGLRLGALAGLLPRQVPRRCGPLLSRQLVRLGGAGGGGAFRPKFGMSGFIDGEHSPLGRKSDRQRVVPANTYSERKVPRLPRFQVVYVND